MTYCGLCLEDHDPTCLSPQTPVHPRFAVVTECVPGLDMRLLQDELKKNGLHWDEAHVTAVVKNTAVKPKLRQVRLAMPKLNAELDYLLDVGCTHVMAVGATVFKALGGEGPVRDAYGVSHTYRGLTIYTCPHPGMASLSTAQADELTRFVASFADMVKGRAPALPTPEIVLVTDEYGVADMVEDLSTAREIAYDIETVGLDEQNPRGHIMCVAYAASEDKAYVVLLQHPECKGDVRSMANMLAHFHKRGRSKVWVAHNGRFDNRWLDFYSMYAPILKRDTIVMAHLLDENAPKNVESVAARYLGIPSWGGEMGRQFHRIKQAAQKGENIPYPSADTLASYAALDVVVELKLSRALWPLLSPSEKRLHHFLLRVGRVLSQAESIGVYVDREATQQAIHDSEQAMESAVQTVGDALGVPATGVKLGSPQWLGKALFDGLGLPVVDHTPSGVPSTNESSLKRLRSHAPDVINTIFAYRKHQKWLGSYLRPWMEQLNNDSRLRSVYNLTGTVTGRLSCTNSSAWGGRMGMSLHQVPRDGTIRNVIRAPEGRSLVVADYSQIELRVAAAIADEPRMSQAYRDGEDIHSLTASIVTGKELDEVTGEDRQRAKAVNFGFLYGMGYKNFVRYAYDQYDMEFSEEEAREIRNNFFRAYYGLNAWHNLTEDFVRRHGYVVSPLGRVRHLPDIHSPDRYLSSEAVRQAINSPVQATASDFTLSAMVLIHQEFSKDPEVFIVGQVHDSIIVECPEPQGEAVGLRVKEIMEKDVPRWVYRQFGYRFPLPLGAESAIGPAWGIYNKVLD